MSKPKQWRDAIEVPVEFVHENEWNPNEVSVETMAQLEENIRQAGFNQPLVVRPLAGNVDDPLQYEVVDGAHRYRAAVNIGMKKVPVIVREFTDAEAKTQTLAMNKLRGEMDPEQVARIVREIESDGIDLTELASYSGYDGAELDGLLETYPETPEPSAALEPSRPGGRGEPVISYQLVFDDAGQQDTWFKFVRHLRAHYTGETIAERLEKFLLEQLPTEAV